MTTIKNYNFAIYIVWSFFEFCLILLCVRFSVWMDAGYNFKAIFD